MSFFRRDEMPRPVRVRRVCEEPRYTRFVPAGAEKLEPQILTIEEYEAIRHVDYQKMTHEECALQMDISRTTVTEIYESARYKIADSLINGKVLCIEGGNYRVCEVSERCRTKSRTGNNEECKN
jgi:predicted DNA-binding protein (UPF0251 family)